jgi:MFS family permease
MLNGIARNGVLFLLVFYLQGVKGMDPVTAGISLAPLAVGLLVLSPISGILADKYGSRVLATAGMVVTGVGLAGLTTIAVDTPIWQLAIWQLIVGAGSGLFNSPNTSAVMGVVPPAKRGIGSGIRAMLTNTGFVVSIALAIGLITTAMSPQVMVAVFSGTQSSTSGIDLGPFISALRLAFWAGVIVSAIGAVVSLLRGGHRSWEEPVKPASAVHS